MKGSDSTYLLCGSKKIQILDFYYYVMFVTLYLVFHFQLSGSSFKGLNQDLQAVSTFFIFYALQN